MLTMSEKLIDEEHLDEYTVRRYFAEDGNISEQILQRVDPLFDENQASRNEGYNKFANVRKVAEIPIALIEEWKVKYGFDWFTASQAERRAILNNPDYFFLRTTEERV